LSHVERQKRVVGGNLVTANINFCQQNAIREEQAPMLAFENAANGRLYYRTRPIPVIPNTEKSKKRTFTD